MQKNPTQTTRVLWHLKAGHKLTALDALNLFGCWRLGARIWDIKEMGFNVKMKLITTSTGKVVGEYSLGNTYKQTNLFD